MVRTYAFIGMERNNAIFAYDITLPSDPSFGRLHDALSKPQLTRRPRIHRSQGQPNRKASVGDCV
jgi:hypothetical protein